MVEVKSLLAGCALLGFLLTACSRSKPVLPPTTHPSLDTPLWDCMVKRDLACMDTVMSHGANLNLVTPDDELRYKMTPLHAAVNLGRPKIVRWLRENGAGLYFRDQNGNLPLHNAACGDSNSLRVVVYANDSLSAKNAEGYTALDLAKSCGKEKNADLLAESMHRNSSSLTGVPAAQHPALADPAHSGRSLFEKPRKERIQIAGEAMNSLVRLGCGLQALEFSMTAGAADSLCDLLVGGESRNTLGSALAVTLEETYSPGAVDSMLVRYTQMAYGNSYPIWISDNLRSGMQAIFGMRRQYQEAVLRGMIEVMAGSEPEILRLR